MADLSPIPLGGLDAVGGRSPKPTDSQVNHSESDDEWNDEAGVEEGENHGGSLETQLLTVRKVLRDYSFKEEEEEEEKAKKEESDSIYSQGSELTSTSPDINPLSR